MTNGDNRSYRIVHLQVQRTPVKIGRAPMRTYDPSPLVPVTGIRVDARGVRGVRSDGEVILDVHHQDHPDTRDAKGRSGILFIGTGDYAVLRERYGSHVTDSIAGETILLDVPEGLAGGGLPGTAAATTQDGPVELRGIRVAEPCVEFSRFCLGRAPSRSSTTRCRQRWRTSTAVPGATGRSPADLAPSRWVTSSPCDRHAVIAMR